MATYVDGYVVPLAIKNVPAYKKMASKAAKIWMEHGALQYFECVGDDLDIKGVGSFRKYSKVKEGETVIFAFIVYKSRAHRDKVNAAVMKDERMHKLCDPKNPPFDMKKMLMGGFKTIVQE